MKFLLLLLLRAYKLGISPMLGQNCRFYPSCSDYAREAIVSHGAVRGSLLAGRRLCKCHPWNAGGFDPVPDISSPVAHHDTTVQQPHS
jgi:putative membrane protein insertion efficiency factor